MKRRTAFFALLVVLAVDLAGAAQPGATAEPSDPGAARHELSKLPFFLGREYFVLRSGRAQMIIQADRADLGPAFTYLLFDAQNARQNVRKDGAFNFTASDGFASSALVVEMGGFPFTALGHRTDTRWHVEGPTPSVEAVWWAGGVRVTERIAALAGPGIFTRTILLEGAHIAGEEAVRVALSVPGGSGRRISSSRAGELLVHDGPLARLALAAPGVAGARIDEARGRLESGPLVVPPGGKASVETIIIVEVPAGEERAFDDRTESMVASIVACRERTRAAWALASSVSTRDPVVRGIFDKARFGLPGMIAEDGTMNAGIFEYGAQWVRDTSNTVIGAIHAGHFELARGTLERVLVKMVTKDGATMIGGGFDEPDREQFDQMGELLHALKAYRDWTGDDSLIREHRERLVSMVERPLHPRFRDATGMVHNRREFWERTFADAYELAYQTWVIQGLRDAADLAPSLGAEDRAGYWKTEAERVRQAMLAHPDRSLVHEGRLTKRRNVTGEVAVDPAGFPGFQPDVPLRSEKVHRIIPDATQALPIALGVVDPRSPVALKTLDDLEGLWNTRWSDGGYDRYHTSSQPDQPGPWSFATCFILRAQHEARLFERSRRSLEWLDSVQGGRAGAWFEEIPSVRSLGGSCGLIPWTSGEIALFVVRHVLGVRFEGDVPVIRPALYPGSPPVSADLRFRAGRLRLEIDGGGPVAGAAVNGNAVKLESDGALRLPAAFSGGTVSLRTSGAPR
jgi:hypothetical protein